jgi:NAD(P)-dependent dehydrogenase (short-subunit alcohol dehydrogenase family)
VRDADAVKAWIEGAAASHGRLDYVFNNAGVGLIGETFEQSLDDWRWVVDVNLNGVIHGVLTAYPLMVAQGHGHIVNTSSISGLCPAPHLTAYAMTKHAVVGLSVSLRAEARALGVRVSCACPGFIETPIIQNAKLTNFDREKATAEVMALANTPESCARAILAGVRRDKAVIVVTRHGKVLSWLQRHAPWLMRMIARSAAKRLRERCRTKPLQTGA